MPQVASKLPLTVAVIAGMVALSRMFIVNDPLTLPVVDSVTVSVPLLLKKNRRGLLDSVKAPKLPSGLLGAHEPIWYVPVPGREPLREMLIVFPPCGA